MNTTNSTTAEPEELLTPTPGEDFIAASICFIVSFFSLCWNGTVAVFTLRLQTMKTQFAYLCVSLAAADCGVLAVFTFWTVPLTFSQNTELATGFIGKKVGQLSLVFWYACLYGTLAIAVNRLLAISYPVSYNVWFRTSNTLKVIALCWILALCHMPIYFFDECDFYYYPPLYIWVYAETNCGAWIGLVADFGYGMVFFTCVFVLNVMTAIKLRKMNQQVGAGKNNQKAQEEAERRRKQEKRFFFQACCNAVMFEIMMSSFHGFSRFATEKWGWFLSVTMFWQISHASNGFLMFIFNPPLRKGMAMACCCLEDTAVVNGTLTAGGGAGTSQKRNSKVARPWLAKETAVTGPSSSNRRPSNLTSGCQDEISMSVVGPEVIGQLMADPMKPDEVSQPVATVQVH